MRISDWSSDVCSSDLKECAQLKSRDSVCHKGILLFNQFIPWLGSLDTRLVPFDVTIRIRFKDRWQNRVVGGQRSEEHTSELQSLMRISYAVFCLKKTNHIYNHLYTNIYK